MVGPDDDACVLVGKCFETTVIFFRRQHLVEEEGR